MAKCGRPAISAAASRAKPRTARIAASITLEVLRHLTMKDDGGPVGVFVIFRGAKLATYQVTFVTNGREVRTDVSDDEYLLDAAAAAGLQLPFMCLQGWCTTCAGKMLEGKVDQAEALRLYAEDEAAGFV